MNRATQSQVVLFLVLSATVAGCIGDSAVQPRLAPVTGRVLLRGQPVAGARVTFLNSSTARAATAETDASGRFQLSTFAPGDGAAVGEHMISVIRPREVKALTAVSENEYAAAQLRERRTSPAAGDLPPRYADPRKSGLRFVVCEEIANECKLDLDGE